MDTHTRNLIAFAHTVREGGVSAAARRLGVSQSAVSQRLKKLEDAVGTKLYFRDRDGFALTKAGQDLHVLADRQADLSALIDERIAGYGLAERGHLSVIGNAPLPGLKLIAGFTQAHPQINVEFAIYDWSTSVELLSARQVDVAVMTAPVESPAWVSQTIEETVYGIYMPSGDELARSEDVGLNDLRGRTLLLTETGSLTERVVAQALTAVDVAPRRVIRMKTFPLIKEAILQGVGLGIFLKGAAGLGEGLTWRPLRDLTERYDICLTVPSGKEELRPVKLFLESAS